MKQTERQRSVHPAAEGYKSAGERVPDKLGSEELNVITLRGPDDERLSHG